MEDQSVSFTPLEAKTISSTLLAQSEQIRLLILREFNFFKEKDIAKDYDHVLEAFAEIIAEFTKIFVSASTEIFKTQKFYNVAAEVGKQKEQFTPSVESLISEKKSRPTVVGRRNRVKELKKKLLQLEVIEKFSLRHDMDDILKTKAEQRLVQKWENARISQQEYKCSLEENELVNQHFEFMVLLQKENYFSSQIDYLDRAIAKLNEQIDEIMQKYDTKMESLENESNIILHSIKMTEMKYKDLQRIYVERTSEIDWVKKQINIEFYARKVQKWWRKCKEAQLLRKMESSKTKKKVLKKRKTNQLNVKQKR